MQVMPLALDRAFMREGRSIPERRAIIDMVISNSIKVKNFLQRNGARKKIKSSLLFFSILIS